MENTLFGLVIFSLFLLTLQSLSPQSEAHSHLRPSISPPPFLRKISSSQVKTQNLHKYPYDIGYFDQNLDHFGFADLPTFRQRYLINFDQWNRSGPIFFYCGNEGEIEWFSDNTGFVWELAPLFGALVIFAEHRYYGESMPYGSSDEAYKNASTLAYLTAEQAIADFVVLIIELKRNLSAEASPVILFGGSYGGMLAAWMRLKYPHIAIGALASSAPVLQFEDIVPPETYYNIVSNAFKRESTSCFNTIKESWGIIIEESEKNDGLLQLGRAFRLCRKLQRSEELYDWLDSAYSSLAMVNYPCPCSSMMPLPGNPVKEVCRRIDNEGGSVLDRIFEGVSVYYNYTGEVECFDLDEDIDGMNGWNWQACTEMVMPMSRDKNSSMFPEYNYNSSAYEEQCWRDFHVKPKPTWITTEFGGHDFKAALKNFGSNIIFSNGLLDPWSGGSVLENISETIVAVVTEKGAHHIDLRGATPDDPDWLVEQRETETKLIEGWVNDYYQGRKGIFDS